MHLCVLNEVGIEKYKVWNIRIYSYLNYHQKALISSNGEQITSFNFLS
jgi:hypothetical protein